MVASLRRGDPCCSIDVGLMAKRPCRLKDAHQPSGPWGVPRHGHGSLRGGSACCVRMATAGRRVHGDRPFKRGIPKRVWRTRGGLAATFMTASFVESKHPMREAAESMRSWPRVRPLTRRQPSGAEGLEDAGRCQGRLSLREGTSCGEGTAGAPAQRVRG
jgi:hypothetical protein